MVKEQKRSLEYTATEKNIYNFFPYNEMKTKKSRFFSYKFNLIWNNIIQYSI